MADGLPRRWLRGYDEFSVILDTKRQTKCVVMQSDPSKEVRRGMGCGTIVALSVVAVIWMAITFLAAARARVVGWPGILSDEGVLALVAISVTLLVIVVLGRNEIAKGSKTTCPKCGGTATAGRFSAWQFVIVICFFPLGLLALLAGQQPAQCPACDHRWQA